MRAELLRGDGVGAGRDPEAGVVRQLVGHAQPQPLPLPRGERYLRRRAVFHVVRRRRREAENDPGVDAGPAAVLPDRPPHLDPLGEV